MPNEVQHRLRWLRYATEVLLLVILALLVARLIWVLVSPQASVASLEERPLPAPVQQGASAAIVDRSKLVEANPFSSSAVEIIPDAPETNLNLKLVGVLMSTGEFGGSAQIMTPDNRTNRYVISDQILQGVTLERIMSDRVIIGRNGDTETLLLAGRSAGLSVIGDGAQPASSNDDSEARVTTGAPPSEYTLNDPDDLFRILTASPKQENGRLMGYSLFPRSDADAFAAAGFVAGDILTEVNGTMVSELNLIELRDEVGASQIATLSVLRDGNPVTLRLRFDT